MTWILPSKQNIFRFCGNFRINLFDIFLIYFNDIPQSLRESGSHLYADDTRIFCQEKNIHKIEDVLNKEFWKHCEWFFDTKLSIHSGEDKTKCIPFSKTKHTAKLNIYYRDHDINHYHNVDYLGFNLDSNLSGKSMAMKVF